MTATTLDDLVSRTRLHLDLNGVQICEMTASVFDLCSDCPLEEVTQGRPAKNRDFLDK